ncbi:hypothetical protein FXW78_32410 [Rhodococcus opacus]|nr:hypothetical protein [Rhodococcus opacus]
MPISCQSARSGAPSARFPRERRVRFGSGAAPDLGIGNTVGDVSGNERRGGCVSKAAVLGAGSWGTAFAKVLADAGPTSPCGRDAVRSPSRSSRGTRTRTTCRASPCLRR